MKKQFLYSIGIDISKAKFDVSVTRFNNFTTVSESGFKNNLSGFNAFFNWLKKHKVNLEQSLFFMESTGRYSEGLACFIIEKGLSTWVGHPTKMSKIMGAFRGKSDKLDARKIAAYGIRYLDQYRAFIPLCSSLKKIRDLNTLRNLLIKTKGQVDNLLGELKTDTTSFVIELIELLKPTQEAKKKALKLIEKKIKEILKSDIQLWQTYKYVVSVKGVGFVTAVQLLIITRGFTRFKSVKELACYCGVAPFPYESGSSVRKRTRVHYAANKRLKTLLHMCALNSVRFDPEIKAFHERRLAKGKHKMSELNVVRNKVLARIWSCVKREQNYVVRDPFMSTLENKQKAA